MNRLAPLLLLLAVSCGVTLHATQRTLTNQDGASIEAELVELTESNGVETIHFKRVSDNRTFKIPLTTLSFEDQRELRTWWKKEQIAKEVLHADDELEISFKRNRKKKNMTTSSYSDDNRYTFTPEAVIKNDDLYQGFTNNKIRIVCLAEHTYYKGTLKVVSVHEEKANFPRKSTTTISGSDYFFSNYESEYSNYEYGWEQAGYVIVIKNSKGEITHITANDSDFRNNVDVALKCEVGDYYSKDLRTKQTGYSY